MTNTNDFMPTKNNMPKTLQHPQEIGINTVYLDLCVSNSIAENIMLGHVPHRIIDCKKAAEYSGNVDDQIIQTITGDL